MLYCNCLSVWAVITMAIANDVGAKIVRGLLSHDTRESPTSVCGESSQLPPRVEGRGSNCARPTLRAVMPNARYLTRSVPQRFSLSYWYLKADVLCIGL